MGVISDNVIRLLSTIPREVTVVAAAKAKTADEILEAIEAGISIIGENYLQESREILAQVGKRAQWHFIGRMQSNKVKHIVPLFDMIETVDSSDLARMIDQHARQHDKIMPVLIAVNSAQEPQKSGVLPDNVIPLMHQMSVLPNLRVLGLMTMGPFLEDPEGLRPYFRLTKALFDEIRTARIPNVEMRYLSMGMSDSYPIAIEEGANMVRIGTKIFGLR